MKETGEKNDKKVAVLIDAENIAPKNIDAILDKASLEGRATVKRIYGDFSSESKSSQARGWNKVVSEHALGQVQQIQNSSGKNSSDSALIIDAMDLLYANTIDVMCLVTNDSDFTRLAMRIADSGLEVIGMGSSEHDCAKSFVSACTKFYYLNEGSKTAKGKAASAAAADKDKAAKPSKKAAPAAAAAPSAEKAPPSGTAAAVTAAAAAKANGATKAQDVPKKVVDTIITAIENEDLDNEDWANIAPIGTVLYRRFPEFDPGLWNRPKQLSLFLKSLDEYFEVAQGETIGKPTGSYIRIRT
ncbi:MAG: NYN domain-containing protein [Clostridiales Family XIII bacterium]|nr:NYN domain-containing protein [Clostridiales Family XIII bacterium]